MLQALYDSSGHISLIRRLNRLNSYQISLTQVSNINRIILNFLSSLRSQKMYVSSERKLKESEITCEIYSTPDLVINWPWLLTSGLDYIILICSIYTLLVALLRYGEQWQDEHQPVSSRLSSEGKTSMTVVQILIIPYLSR